MDRDGPMDHIRVFFPDRSLDDESNDCGIGRELFTVLWQRYLARYKTRPSADAVSWANAPDATPDCAHLPHVWAHERRCAAYAVSILLKMRRRQLLLSCPFAEPRSCRGTS